MGTPPVGGYRYCNRRRECADSAHSRQTLLRLFDYTLGYVPKLWPGIGALERASLHIVVCSRREGVKFSHYIHHGICIWPVIHISLIAPVMLRKGARKMQDFFFLKYITYGTISHILLASQSMSKSFHQRQCTLAGLTLDSVNSRVRQYSPQRKWKAPRYFPPHISHCTPLNHPLLPYEFCEDSYIA